MLKLPSLRWFDWGSELGMQRLCIHRAARLGLCKINHAKNTQHKQNNCAVMQTNASSAEEEDDVVLFVLREQRKFVLYRHLNGRPTG